MANAPKLPTGGRPTQYSEKQRAEMARLAGLYGVTGPSGAIAILQADGYLADRRDATVFPQPVQVSQPTITEAAKLYKVKVSGSY